MKSLLAALGLVIATSTAALAGGRVVPVDPYVPPPPPAPAYNWTGGYVGLFVGMTSGSNRWDETSGPAFSTPGDWTREPAGVMLGYNWQSGRTVYGAELDYSATTLTAVSTTGAGFGCLGLGCGTDVSGLMSLRARAGVAMDRTLLYGTLGFARANARGYNPGTATVSGTGTVSGWSAGLGIEHAVSDRFTIRAEYLHTDLGRLQLPVACGVDCYTDIRFGQLRLGAAFRF